MRGTQPASAAADGMIASTSTYVHRLYVVVARENLTPIVMISSWNYQNWKFHQILVFIYCTKNHDKQMYQTIRVQEEREPRMKDTNKLTGNYWWGPCPQQQIKRVYLRITLLVRDCCLCSVVVFLADGSSYNSDEEDDEPQYVRLMTKAYSVPTFLRPDSPSSNSTDSAGDNSTAHLHMPPNSSLSGQYYRCSAGEDGSNLVLSSNGLPAYGTKNWSITICTTLATHCSFF